MQIFIVLNTDMLINFEYKNDNLVFNRITRTPASFKEEIYNSAKLIYSKATRPLVVGMSGGKDSELICHVLHELNIPFKPLFIRYINAANSSDMYYINNFCENRGIKPIIADIDAREFYSTGIEKYIEKGYCSVNLFRYLQLLILETAEDMGFSCILGCPDYRFLPYKGELVIPFDSDIDTPLQWCRDNNYEHFPFFYYSTPEIYAAYLKEDLIDFVLKDGGYHNMLVPPGFMPEKELIYRKNFPMLQNRTKTTGFEQLFPLRHQKQDELQIRFPNLKRFYLSVDTIKSQLGI